MSRVACCWAALGASSVMAHLVTRTTIAYCVHRAKSADGLSSWSYTVSGRQSTQNGLPICCVMVRREVRIWIFKCIVALRNASIIHPLHSARPFQSWPMRYHQAILLQIKSWPARSQAVLRTPRRWSAFPRRRDDSVIVSTSEKQLSTQRGGWKSRHHLHCHTGSWPASRRTLRRRRRAPARRHLPAWAHWASFAYCPCCSSTLRPTVHAARNEASSPRSPFVAVDVLLLAPVLRDPRVSKNRCRAIGCSSVAMTLKKVRPRSTWLWWFSPIGISSSPIHVPWSYPNMNSWWFSQAFTTSFPDTRVNASRASWNLRNDKNSAVWFCWQAYKTKNASAPSSLETNKAVSQRWQPRSCPFCTLPHLQSKELRLGASCTTFGGGRGEAKDFRIKDSTLGRENARVCQN